MTSLIRRTVCGFVHTRRAKLFCQSILGLTCRHKLGLIYSSSLNYSTVNSTVFYCFNVMQILSCWLDSVFYCWIILFYLLPGLLVSSVRRLEPIGKCSKKMGPISMNVQYWSKLSCAIILFSQLNIVSNSEDTTSHWPSFDFGFNILDLCNTY